MAHGVDCPRVLNHEEGNPLPLIDVDEIPSTRDYGDGVDNEERRVEFKFVTRDFFVVGDVAEELFHMNSISVRIYKVATSHRV